MTFIRKPEFATKLGLKCPKSINKPIIDGLITRPVQPTGTHDAWPDYEVEAIVKFRKAGKTNDDVRALVELLHKARLAGTEQAQIEQDISAAFAQTAEVSL